MNFSLSPNKKVYFASDLHLIMEDATSRQREKDFIQWLNTVKNEAEAIFLLGDMFDFWFEYRRAVPRGFVRFLGKIGELTDAGLPIHYFTGNHDLWISDYLQEETGVKVYRQPTPFVIDDKKFLIGHGHYLGPVGIIEKIFRRVFNNKFLRILYASLHPRWGISFGKNWSKNSRARHGLFDPFIAVEEEEIAQYAREQLSGNHYDFFVFGHRHLAMDIHLGNNSRYINTGEWIDACSYAVFDGKDVSLHSFKGEAGNFIKM